jgi:uncharacterized repeat protein (TIGR01451 family)
MKSILSLVVFSCLVLNLNLHADPVSGTLYYTRYAGSPRVKKVDFTYDGATSFTLNAPVAIADLPGADGLVIAPDGNLIIGGQGNAIYKVDPVTGTVTSQTAGGGASYHMSMDPNRQRAWSGWESSGLIEVPLNPFGPGILHTLTGDDTHVDTIAWDETGTAYYTISGAGGFGNFGVIDLTTFKTTRKLSNVAAAHGMSFDPLTKTFILMGDSHISQVAISGGTASIISELTFSGVQFDQGTVDGVGHVFVADNNGSLVFIDFAASKKIGDPSNFVLKQFLDGSLDDVAPISLVGTANRADLSGVFSGPAAVSTHESSTFSLTVSNAGPDAATQTAVTIALPANVQFISAADPGCTYSDGQIHCAIPTLASGQSLKLDFTVQALTGPFQFRANILPTETDPIFANNNPVSQSITAGPSCVDAPSGIISLWSAEGDSTDALGLNNATLQGSTSFVSGEVGQAFRLNGINNYVSVADNATLRPKNVTLEGWFNFASTALGHLVSKTFGTGEDDSYVIWYNGGLRAATTDPAQLFFSWTPTLGTWYHIAYTFDDANHIEKLFINGALVASSATTQSIKYDAHPFLIGADIGNEHAGNVFSGSIDEVAIYNRALSDREIQLMYLAGNFGKCSQPVLVPVTLPEGVPGQPYNASLTLAHASPPFDFQLTGGSLPPGINLSLPPSPNFALLVGAPTTVGTYTFTISGKDFSNQTAAQNYTIPVVNCTAAPLGLLGWWRAEGNANDEVGSHNGVLQSNAKTGAGRAGQAFQLDGAAAYVDLGRWSPGSRWTTEAWVNPSALPAGRRGILGGFNECLDWGLSLQDGDFGVTIKPPGGCSLTVKANAAPQPGTWYHVAATCDGTNATLYVNGQLKVTTPVEKNYIGTAGGVRIGSEVCCGAFFPGLVDEAAIYNRALGGDEIRAIFNAGAAGKCSLGVPPQVTSSPANATISPGAPVTFQATASSSETLSYQWYFNGVPIVGQTGPTLTLPNPTSADSGLYTVAVISPSGTILAPSFAVTVLDIKMFAGLVINGIVGRNYRIDYSNDLGTPVNWTTLVSSINVNANPFTYIDLTSPTFPKRFYRAVLLP